LGLVPLAALLGLVGWSLAQRGTAPGGTGVNAQGSDLPVTRRPAPELRLELFDPSGASWRLADQLGKPVVINFWASWCAPCRTEAGTLAQAARDYTPRGTVFVGADLWDDPVAAKAFLTEFGIAYPNGLDTTGTAGVAYAVTGIPETFVVDAQGRLTEHWVGPLTRTTLDSLLAGKAER